MSGEGGRETWRVLDLRNSRLRQGQVAQVAWGATGADPVTLPSE